MTPLSNNQKKGRRKLSPFIAGTVAAGLCCALYAGIFPFYRIGDYVIGLALSAFAGWLVSTMAQGLDTSKPAPSQQKIPETGNAAADAQIRQGQELMHKIRLASPETVELCYELNKHGFDLPLDRLDPEECAQALYNAIKA